MRLTERAGVPGGDVEQRRPDEAHHQRRDDRQQAGDARRLPRREEEPDRRARRRTSRGGGRCAPGSPASVPRISARDRHRDLHDRDGQRGSSAARGCVSGSRVGTVRIRHRWRRGSPGVRSGIAGAGASRVRCGAAPRRRAAKAAAVGAAGEVGVDRRRRRVRGPRRRGGRRSPDGCACRSYGVVAAEDRGVPPVSSVAVDDLHAAVPRRTRRRPHRRSCQAIRASQADVWRLACHLVGADEADDVTQDTFVRAWRALPAFRGDSSARTWLLSIARRACADAVAAHRAPAPPRRAGSSSGATLPAREHRRPAAAPTRFRRSSTSCPRPARRVRAHADGRVLVRGGGGGCGVPIGTIRSRRGAGARASSSTRCAGRRPDERTRGAPAPRAASSPRSSCGDRRRDRAHRPARTGSAACTPHQLRDEVLQR